MKALFFLLCVRSLFAENATDPNIFVSLAKRVMPSIVNVSSTLQAADFFRLFEVNQPRQMPVFLGTGFVIDANGLIITNNHVVMLADEIFIACNDAAPIKAKLVGRDEALDVALLHVDTKLIPLVFGNSDAVEVGEYVLAVGNPFGQGHSVTHGIISAKGRASPNLPLATYLQTDAPINPGNSGGPLVNLKGEVIGINNAIDVRAQGIGFAIPSNIVLKHLEELKTKGAIERGYLGVIVGDMEPELAEKLGVPQSLQAPLVTQVTPGDPAAKAGIQPYDLITAINDKPLHTANELIVTIADLPVNEVVTLHITRSGKDRTVKVQIGSRTQKKPPTKAMGPSGLHTEAYGSGVRINDIDFKSPADEAGLSRGDIILEIDKKPIHTPQDLAQSLSGKQKVMLRVQKSESIEIIMLDMKK